MTFEQAIRKQQKKTDEYKWPKMTYGHVIQAVFEIHDVDSAREFRNGYIKWLGVNVDPVHTPEQVADANIGWCFGEGMPESDRAIWHSLGAAHPVFGTMEKDPTPEEALEAGRKAAEALKK